MDRELRAKWCGALRSGEYKQGRFSLRPDSDSYCCLGVLAVVGDLAAHDGIDSDGNADYEPIHQAGVPELQCSALIDMNDKERLSFREIADWIEQNL